MRILFLSSWFPYPPINGAKIRIYNLIRQLAYDHEITLVSFAQTIGLQEAQAHIPLLEQYCRSVDVVAARPFAPNSLRSLPGFISAKPRSVVHANGHEMIRCVANRMRDCEYNVVVASEVGAPSATSLVATRIAGLPKVLDALEVGLAKEAYYTPTSRIRRIRPGLTWHKLRHFTRGLLLRSSACTVPSLQERRNLLEIAPEHPCIEVVPHCLDLDHYTGSFGSPQPKTLVFTGSFTYHANLDAASYFLEEIYPRIKRNIPDVTLRIVGSTNGVALDALSIDDSVTFTGLLRDVRPVVSQSWLSVVPLRVGAGTRLKIIESMALGTPVVSTSKGAEGLEVAHGENILIADDPDAFAQAVQDMLSIPRIREKLATEGRRLVREKYSTRIMGQQFGSLLAKVVMNG
jgi:glycosyltransferase involved in cell wall biosynthesis